MRIPVACLLLAFVVVLSTGGGWEKHYTDTNIQRGAVATTDAHKTTTDVIPKYAFRIDDGSNWGWHKGTIMSCLRDGNEVFLGIIVKSTTAASVGLADPVAGKAAGTDVLTWAQIRALADSAEAYGTTLSLGHHTYSTFNSSTPWTQTYAELMVEVERDSIYVHTGIMPTVFVFPGNAGANTWNGERMGWWRTVLLAEGYEYALMQEGERSYEGQIPQVLTAYAVTTGVDGPGKKPGSFRGYEKFFLDNGGPSVPTTLIERAAGSMTLADLSGDVSDGGHAKVFQYHLYAAIADNAGFIIGWHDLEDSTDSVVMDLGGATFAPPIEVPGHFSPFYISALMKQLEDAGHLEVVSVEEYCDWVTSEFAPNTDLIQNTDCYMPQWDPAVCDTAGVQFAWVRGFGSAGFGLPDWNDLTFHYFHGAANIYKILSATDGTFDRTGRHPYKLNGFGAGDSTFVGFKGSGKMVVPQAGSQGKVGMVFGALQPGGYELTMQVWVEGDDRIYVVFPNLTMTMKYFDAMASLEDSTTHAAYGDTTMSYYVGLNNDFSPGTVFPQEQWQSLTFRFDVPEPDFPWFRATDMEVDFGGAVTLTDSLIAVETALEDVLQDILARPAIGRTDYAVAGTTVVAERVWLTNSASWAWACQFGTASGDWMEISHPTLTYLGRW